MIFKIISVIMGILVLTGLKIKDKDKLSTGFIILVIFWLLVGCALILVPILVK